MKTLIGCWLKQKKIPDEHGVFNGLLLMDEMSIQQDLQFVKKGQEWEIVGSVDLGELVNDLDEVSPNSKSSIVMASHYFQYIYVGLSGFCWPVAYYASNNVNGHSIYLTVWPLLDTLHTHGFNVMGILMDGSNNNHQFCRLMVKSENARLFKYSASNPYDPDEHVSLIQDCKHVFKKIRNLIFSSRRDGKSVPQLKYKGKFIFWEHFEEAYDFNCRTDLQLYRKLSCDHVKVTDAGKMHNHLAINVLNHEMLHLMLVYQQSLEDSLILNSTIALLQQTSTLVDIFCNNSSKVEDLSDPRIGKLLNVLQFFHDWESEFFTPQEKAKHLISRQPWEDIDSSIYGFIQMVKLPTEMHIPLVPGYFNSDLIKNWFCQIWGLCNGFNQNPTLSQIGPAINSNLITGSIVSLKGNTSGTG